MRVAGSALALGLACSSCARVAGAPAIPSQAVPFASSGGYKSLYSFGGNGKSNDGRTPIAGLIAVGTEFYGTTENGGATNAYCSLGCGTVFKVSRSGAEQVIYRFGGAYGGATPTGTLLNSNGTLYGTTSAGGLGSSCAPGCGTVYKVSPDGKSETVLYRFKGGSDGAVPLAGLVSLGGVLYGTTQYGGKTTHLCPAGCGTVFSLTTGGSEGVLHAFDGGTDGASPIAGLLAFNGALYGTTQYGGRATALCATGCGTIFSLTTGGAKKTLHNFNFSPASRDGAYPAAGLTAFGGDLYGTTLGGGKLGDGVVFKLDLASGSERAIHSFSCCSTRTDGDIPMSRLTRVGKAFYGTTRNGGTANAGTIFVVTPSGAESVLHDFGGKPDGAHPQARLLPVNGSLYGTTPDGGSQSGGTVFSLKL
jgi:uncharacterized repeat protein (TIGR03803 family)